MPHLQRVTTEYIDTEDRVRLTGALGDGGVVRLWLTQRLLNRLLPHLLGWLEQQIGPATPGAEMIQEFAQHAAREALAPQAPVEALPSDLSCLVDEVSVLPGGQAVALTFKTRRPDGGLVVVGSLAFESQPLRQWLGILFDQYGKAEWPLSAWPAWFAPDAPAGSSAAQSVLH